MGAGSYTFSSYLTWMEVWKAKLPAAGGKEVWGRSPQRLAILGHLLPK